MLILLALLFFITPSFAQDDVSVQRKARAYDMVTAQRNQAMDSLAVCVGEYGHQLEDLRKELEQAKQACEKPKE